MLEFYNAFISRYDIDGDTLAFLCRSGELLITQHADELTALIDEYFAIDFKIAELEEKRRLLAEQSGIPFYTVNFIMLVCAAKRLLPLYRERGYSEKLFYDTFEDYIYKLRECIAVKNTPGIFVEQWYSDFFRLKIFKLGRLEFQISSYNRDEPYTKDGLTVKKGDTVISVHIPSSGRFSRELREESYALAYEFFEKQRLDDRLVFTCSSWLLYDKNREIFPPHLNVVDFLSDWDIIDSREDEKFGNCWRLFSVDYTGDPSVLPHNTTQQRAMVSWLASGKHSGCGFGVRIQAP